MYGQSNTIKGQLNIFDYMQEQEPQVLSDYAVRLFFADGYSQVYKYNKPFMGMWDKEIAKHCYILNYEELRGGLGQNGMKFRTPCFRVCNVECWSLSCFLNRGYMRHDGKWIRGEDGKILIANDKICDWTPREE